MGLASFAIVAPDHVQDRAGRANGPRSNFSRVAFSRAVYPHRDTIRPMTWCDRYFHGKEIQRSFRALEPARGKHPLRFFSPRAIYRAIKHSSAAQLLLLTRARVERERGSRQFTREPEKISESPVYYGNQNAGALLLHWDSKRASCVILVFEPHAVYIPR